MSSAGVRPLRLLRLLCCLAALAALQVPAAQGAERWRPRAPMPTARSGAAAAVLDGQLCVVGGYYTDGGQPHLLTAHECYDPRTDRWSRRAPLPSPRSGAFAVALDGKMYVVGGVDQAQISSDLNERYDPKTDRWERLPPLPTSRVVPVAAAVGRTLYVIGGEREAPDFSAPYLRPVAANEAFDVDRGTWSRRAPMPTARPRPSVAVSSERILVLGGGQVDAPPVLRAVEEYDPARDAWRVLARLPTARTAAFAGLLKGRVHVFGGYVDDASARPEPFRFLTANEAFDPATLTWQAAAPLPGPRGGFAGGVIDGRVYLVGGYCPGRGYLSLNEEYTPAGPR